jgi:hypothetical protein
MKGHRLVWTVIVVAVGVLQGWDSGVFQSTAIVHTLVGLAIAAPAGSFLLTNNRGVQAITVAAAFVLLTIARMLAPTPLPTLHLIAFVPALIVVFSSALRKTATA